MSSREGGGRPIIIVRRRRKKGGEGHHGGAWKVAYADFVTAMMAFFLLLWLLNTVTTEQRQGIADYFDTAGVSAFQGGARDIFGGETITQKGSSDSGSDHTVVPSSNAPTPPTTSDTAEAPMASATGPETPQPSGQAASGENSSVVAAPAPGDENALSLLRQVTGANGRAERKAEGTGPENAAATAAEIDRKNLDAAANQLRETIHSQPELAALANSVIIEVIPEGMRVQLVDELRQPMFALGSANLLPQTRKLLGTVAAAVGKLPNRIVVTGHTDATPFASQTTYGNWELSADRANATRRSLSAAGIQESRFYEVSGKAGTEPLLPEDPKNAANRRISILLLRQAEPGPPTASP